jgi:hypothetical protein
MANLTYSADIIEYALFRAGEPIDGTSDFDDHALVALNRAYRAMWEGGGEFDPQINVDWWWLLAEGSLILQAPIETGTVQVTNNSDSIAFSVAPSSSSVDGWFFKVESSSDVFVISAHTGGATAATLDTVYTGDDASAASFRLMKLEYSLASDHWKTISPMRAYKDARHRVIGTSMRQMEDDYPLGRILAGVPERFAPISDHSVRFNRYGKDELVRLDYDYLKIPDDLTDSDSEEPLVPKMYRHILADATEYYLLKVKDDDRADAMVNQVRAGIKSMSRENRNRWSQFGEPGKIIPRPSDLDFIRRFPRTESGLYMA